MLQKSKNLKCNLFDEMKCWGRGRMYVHINGLSSWHIFPLICFLALIELWIEIIYTWLSELPFNLSLRVKTNKPAGLRWSCDVIGQSRSWHPLDCHLEATVIVGDHDWYSDVVYATLRLNGCPQIRWWSHFEEVSFISVQPCIKAIQNNHGIRNSVIELKMIIEFHNIVFFFQRVPMNCP